MKLSQAQLAFDPRVAKLHHSSAPAILLLRFLAGHLFPEGNHRRIFHPSRYSAPMALIFRTALRLMDARLTVAEFCFVKIGDDPPLLVVVTPLGPQHLALLPNIPIHLRLRDERTRRKSVRARHSARHLFPPHASPKLHVPLIHLLHLSS